MSNVKNSPFFDEGFRAGYDAVYREGKQCSPSDPEQAAQYLAGWDAGVREGNLDAAYEASEQAYYDRINGL